MSSEAKDDAEQHAYHAEHGVVQDLEREVDRVRHVGVEECVLRVKARSRVRLRGRVWGRVWGRVTARLRG